MFAEDKLFATLDPTTRRVRLPTNQNALLSDTVGFFRKLPHQLVESFKATLEEVVVADLLMHVVDAGNPRAAEQIEAVNEVLKEIDGGDKPMLMVFNKVDLLPSQKGTLHWLRDFDHAVAVSAKKKDGLDELMYELGIMLRPIRSYLQLAIPQGDGQAIARIRAVGQIDEENYEGDRVHLQGTHSSAPSRRVREIHREGSQRQRRLGLPPIVKRTPSERDPSAPHQGHA